MSEVLRLFEGLDERQARRFRKAIMPTLQELRRQILNEQGKNKQRLQHGKMQSKNKRGRTVQNATVEGQ